MIVKMRVETYVDTSRRQRLAGVICLGRHLCHIEDEVSDLPKELVLVDVPVGKRRSATKNRYILVLGSSFLPFGTTPFSTNTVSVYQMSICQEPDSS